MQIQPYENRIDIRYEEAQFTLDDLLEINEEERQQERPLAMHIIGWTQMEDEEVAGKDLDRTSKATVIVTSGSPQEFILGSPEIVGDVTQIQDNEVIISSELAYTLWGNDQVIGQEITYKEQEYKVRAVVKDKESWIIGSLIDSDEVMLTNLRIVGIDKNNIEANVRVFEGRHGINDGVIINFSTMAILVSQCIYVIPLYFIVHGLRRMYVISKSLKWKYLIRLAIVGGTMISGDYLFNRMLELPDHIMPNRWSQFDFWINKVSAMHEQRSLVQAFVQTRIEKGFEYRVAILVGLVLMSIIVIIKRKKPKES